MSRDLQIDPRNPNGFVITAHQDSTEKVDRFVNTAWARRNGYDDRRNGYGDRRNGYGDA
jgi:hypothetical protein